MHKVLILSFATEQDGIRMTLGLTFVSKLIYILFVLFYKTI